MNSTAADPTPAPGPAQRLLDLPASLQFAGWLALILLLDLPALFEPPVWDSAMGAFPPAIYLFESGFDIRALLQEPNWWQGGPNVHSLSLFVWFLAAVMSATGDALATFVLVHGTTFTLVAWSLVEFTRALRSHALAASTALAAAALWLCLPVVLVQVGYLYMDSWVMVFGVTAWARASTNRLPSAVLFCILAIFTKLTALPIAACLFVAILLRREDPLRRRIAWAAAIPAAIALRQALPGALGAASHPRGSWGEPGYLIRAMFEWLSYVPDLALLIVVALAFACIGFGTRIRNAIGRRAWPAFDAKDASLFVCQAMPIVFSLGVFQQVLAGALFLPRYLVPVIPFAIATVALSACAFGWERGVRAVLVTGGMLSLVNYGGVLYPEEHVRFSIVERSHAYRDFNDVQRQAIAALARKPADTPAFVSRELDYMISHPMMGYVEEAIPNVHPIYLAPYASLPLDAYPDEFLLIHSNAGHGGAEMQRIFEAARTSQSYDIRVAAFENEPFQAQAFWLKKRSSVLDPAEPALGARP